MSGTGERLFGIHTIYSVNDQPPSPYMTRVWIGRLRLHIFHRGDLDADCHDHPWDFWTLPFTSYIEEIAEWDQVKPNTMRGTFKLRYHVVRAFRLHYRPATHCHRVMSPAWQIGVERSALRRSLGRPVHQDDIGQDYAPDNSGSKIVTLVWRGKSSRSWGFLKNRDDQWCWVPWKEYIFGGGKAAPCSPQVLPEKKDLPQ